MTITPETLRSAIATAAEAAREAETDLNAADAKMGDGDTGVTVRRLFEALDAHKPSPGDLGETFKELARVCSSATGSSLGTLVTVAMMTLAKRCAGHQAMAWGELSSALGDVRDQMLKRGGANLGDKTVIDMLDAIIRATDSCAEPSEFARAATGAADQTLQEFRDKPNRIGRARMFAERSVGLDDPGMLAMHRLLLALAGGATADV